jgi:hypothetical protein
MVRSVVASEVDYSFLTHEWLLSHSGVHIWMRPCLSTNDRQVSFVLCSLLFILTTCLSYIVPVIQRGVGAYIGRVHIYEESGLIKDLQSHWYKCLPIAFMHAHFLVSRLLDTARPRAGADLEDGVTSILLFPTPLNVYELLDITGQIVNRDYSHQPF